MDDRSRASSSKRGLGIAFHGVGEVGERHPLDLTLDVKKFEAQVRYLQHRYTLVRASELPAAARARRWGQKLPVAISFDDDLRSHLSLAKPVLDRLGAPATFFLGGASLDEPLTFWWERLERAFVAGSIAEEELHGLVPPRQDVDGNDTRDLREIVTDIEFMEPSDRDELAELLGRRAGRDPDDAGLRRADIRDLSAGGRYEIGFHTRSHYNLTILDDSTLADELTVGRAEVAEAAGQELTTIAYPGGRWNHRVADAAREAGYEFGFTCDPIPVDPGSGPLHLGRLVPTWCVTPGELAFAVASAMAGHYPAWPLAEERPKPTLAPSRPADNLAPPAP